MPIVVALMLNFPPLSLTPIRTYTNSMRHYVDTLLNSFVERFVYDSENQGNRKACFVKKACPFLIRIRFFPGA